jgi:Domain of unknown function (DUF4328)
MRQLSLALFLLSGLVVVLHILVMVPMAYQAVSMLNLLHGIAWDAKSATESDNIIQQLDAIRRIAFFIAAFIFLFWTYHVLKTVEAQGITLDRKPAASVAMICLPFVNFVGAPMAIGGIHSYVFSKEERDKRKKWIAIWWAAYLVGSIALLIIPNLLEDAASHQQIQDALTYEVIQIVIYAALAFSGFVFTKLTREISAVIRNPLNNTDSLDVFD